MNTPILTAITLASIALLFSCAAGMAAVMIADSLRANGFLRATMGAAFICMLFAVLVLVGHVLGAL